MSRTEAQKISQKKYRMANRAKINRINNTSRKRCYNAVGRAYQKEWYIKNRNYIGTDNMSKTLIALFHGDTP